MKQTAGLSAPVQVGAPSRLETLPEDIEKLTHAVRAECDEPPTLTQSELLEALDLAWLSAERWRLERAEALTGCVSQH